MPDDTSSAPDSDSEVPLTEAEQAAFDTVPEDLLDEAVASEAKAANLDLSTQTPEEAARYRAEVRKQLAISCNRMRETVTWFASLKPETQSKIEADFEKQNEEKEADRYLIQLYQMHKLKRLNNDDFR